MQHNKENIKLFKIEKFYVTVEKTTRQIGICFKMQLRKLNMGFIKKKFKKRLMKINTLHINVRFINGSKHFRINISSEWRYSRQCSKREIRSLDIKNFTRQRSWCKQNTSQDFKNISKTFIMNYFDNFYHTHHKNKNMKDKSKNKKFTKRKSGLSIFENVRCKRFATTPTLANINKQKHLHIANKQF